MEDAPKKVVQLVVQLDDASQAMIPATALAHAEIVDLADSSEPYQQVPAHLRPRFERPGQELLRILGPALVCRIVMELESIHDSGASTHIDLRIHTDRGMPRRVDFVPVQTFQAYTTNPTLGRSRPKS